MIDPKDDRSASRSNYKNEAFHKADGGSKEPSAAREDSFATEREHSLEQERGRSRRRVSAAKQSEYKDSAFAEDDRDDRYEPVKPKKRKKRKGKKKSRSLSLPSLPKIKLPSSLAVLISRISQLACFLLMAKTAWTPLMPLIDGREGLGSVRIFITERNYSLACYLALSGSYLAFTVLSALWILTKRHFAGKDRVVSADIGRGLTAFLLLVLAFWSAPFLLQALHGQPLLPGAARFLEIMASLSEPLLNACALGFLLSILRKILKR